MNRRHELTPDEVHTLDREVAELAGSEGRRRLYLGEALSWMERHGAAQKLGFTDTGTYGYETIQQRKRWCDESRWLAKRLTNLPLLRDALVRDVLHWSMVETLARAATPETEAELIALARTRTVRAMKAQLAKQKDEPTQERSTVTATVDRVDALYFESTRMLVSAIADSPSSDELAEALLAEGLTRLIADVPGLDLPNMREFETQLATLRAQMSVAQEEREAERDAKRARLVSEAEAEQRNALSVGLSDDPFVQDLDVLRQLKSFAAVDVQLSKSLRRLAFAEPWEILGYASLGHYARERLGMSEATARSRMDLAYAFHIYPALEAAVLDGRVGLESARMVGRIAEPNTIDEWVERAAERTVKVLREDVEAAGLLSRVTGDRRLSAPPDEEALEAVFELERAVLAGVVASPQMSVDEPDPEPVQLPKVVIKLAMRDDTARFWRALERVYARVAKTDMPFVTFLCRCVWQSWRDSEARMSSYKYLDVYLRERFRCANPVCSRRDVTVHHVIYRAHGGGEDRWNLVAICSRCHLEGVHRNFIAVKGNAPDQLRWSLAGGRVVVEGRRKRQA